MKSNALNINISDDYKDATPLDWARYEFATIQYDYNVHPEAARRIDDIFKRLSNKEPK